MEVVPLHISFQNGQARPPLRFRISVRQGFNGFACYAKKQLLLSGADLVNKGKGPVPQVALVSFLTGPTSEMGLRGASSTVLSMPCSYSHVSLTFTEQYGCSSLDNSIWHPA